MARPARAVSALVAVSVTLAYLAPGAGAMSRAAADATAAASVKVAANYWPLDGCSGRVRVGLLTSAGLAALRGAELIPADADADAGTCSMRLAWDAFDSRARLCAVVVHERGHLAGLRFDNPADPHHSRGRDVMAAGTPVVPRPCMVRFTPYAVRVHRRSGRRCTPIATQLQWRCTRTGRWAVYVDAI